jgi:hypothetical protein
MIDEPDIAVVVCMQLLKVRMPLPLHLPVCVNACVDVVVLASSGSREKHENAVLLPRLPRCRMTAGARKS